MHNVDTLLQIVESVGGVTHTKHYLTWLITLSIFITQYFTLSYIVFPICFMLYNALYLTMLNNSTLLSCDLLYSIKKIYIFTFPWFLGVSYWILAVHPEMVREGLKKKPANYPHFVDKRLTPPPLSMSAEVNNIDTKEFFYPHLGTSPLSLALIHVYQN